MEIDRESILSVVANEEGVTLNKIAKDGLDLSKANQALKDEVAKLVEEGKLTEDNSGRYTLYSIGEAGEDVDKAGEVSLQNAQEIQLPTKEFEGFTVESNPKVRNGKIVTTPEGNSIELGGGESLVVINGVAQYLAQEPSDVISCISDYTTEHDMVTFVVKDIKANKVIGSAGDVQLDEGRILALEITKHNKAA